MPKIFTITFTGIATQYRPGEIGYAVVVPRFDKELTARFPSGAPSYRIPKHTARIEVDENDVSEVDVMGWPGGRNNVRKVNGRWHLGLKGFVISVPNALKPSATRVKVSDLPRMRAELTDEFGELKQGYVLPPKDDSSLTAARFQIGRDCTSIETRIDPCARRHGFKPKATNRLKLEIPCNVHVRFKIADQGAPKLLIKAEGKKYTLTLKPNARGIDVCNDPHAAGHSHDDSDSWRHFELFYAMSENYEHLENPPMPTPGPAPLAQKSNEKICTEGVAPGCSNNNFP